MAGAGSASHSLPSVQRTPCPFPPGRSLGRSPRPAVLTASAQAILDDPTRFLHAIDVDGDRAFFVRTDPELLRQESFVDGRVPFATSEPVAAPLSTLLPANSQPADSDRLLFNCSFCGSTLLARLLDQPGRSLVLKEPRSLTDLAAWKTLNIRDGLPTDRLGALLSFARAALRRRYAPEEAVTIKVANQGNVLLESLATDSAGIRPVFITISRLDFLRAVFRGGVERMHHAAATAWHMATGLPEGDALLKEAVKAGGDPLRKAANLAVLARFLQVGTFQKAARAGGWGERHVIDYSTIARQPHEAASKAARA